MPSNPGPGLQLKTAMQDQKLAVLRRQQVQVTFECFGALLQQNSGSTRWDSQFVGQIWERESGRLSIDDPDRKSLITVDHWPASERLLAEAEGWPREWDMVIRVFHHELQPQPEDALLCATCGQVLRQVLMEAQGDPSST